MRRTSILISVLFLLFYAATVHGGTIRYALIIGNNEGMDSDGSRPFAPLMHAEREAAVLRDKLVSMANFDKSPTRTRLLVGATKQDVQRAIHELVRKQKVDKATFGDVDTLFLFYFTGHGLNGRLLLKDGALLADEVGKLFSAFDANFSIGVFDACFSGSLDGKTLMPKGMRSAPGLNLFRELPDEVLSAEGSVWYVSSGSNQASFEDKRIGGVFTHFFIEALENGEVTGPGITLENVWQYARAHTVEFTAERKRIQAPEQYISNLRSNAPIYFSYVKSRSATLILSKELEGRFALAYKMGNLTEVFEKKAGTESVLAVYPGSARLVLVDRNNNITSRKVMLSSGEKLILGDMIDPSITPKLGERIETLYQKGASIETTVTASRVKKGLSLLAGLGYRFNFSHNQLLFSRHGFSIPLRFDVGQTYFGVEFKYGIDKRNYPAWFHTVHDIGGRVFGGYGVDVNSYRFGIGAAFETGALLQYYDNEERRIETQLKPLVEFIVLHRTNRFVLSAIYADIGGVYGPGIGAASENLWFFSAAIGAKVYFRIH